MVPTPDRLETRNLIPYSEELDCRVTKVVLGHYPEYIHVAADIGAHLFEMEDNDFGSCTSSQVWGLNRHFLDQMYHSGAVFILATAPEKARPGSWFEQEIRYLLTLGIPVYLGHERLFVPDDVAR